MRLPLGLLLRLRLLPIQRRQPAAQVLRLASQLLLPPALLGRQRLLAIRFLCELLLTFGELLELAQRLLHLLVLVRLGKLRFTFILTLLDIHLELEHLAEVTRRLRTLPAAFVLHGYLDFAECGFRSKELLQRLLLDGNGLLELKGGEVRGRRLHRDRRPLQAFDELLDALVGFDRRSRSGTRRQR